METKELLKEAVKAEVVKLMAQELLKEDSFEKMKSELAAELFELKETEPKVTVTVTETVIDKPEEKKDNNPTFVRELNPDWGYDPINKQEENLKQMLGFLPNMKDIRKGFKGQEISLEEKEFMENSSFTKIRIIDELKKKIKDLEQSLPINMPYIEDIELVKKDDNLSEKLESSSEKLKDFKARIYGDKSEIPKPIIGHQMAEYVLNKQKQKLGESFSSYITEHYKDIIIPEASGATVESKSELYKKSTVPDFILKAKDKAGEALESAIKMKRTPIKKEVVVVKEPSKKTSAKKASSKKKTNKK